MNTPPARAVARPVIRGPLLTLLALGWCLVQAAGSAEPPAVVATSASIDTSDDPLNMHRPPGYGVYDDVYDFYMNVPRHDWHLFKAGEIHLDLAYLVANPRNHRIEHGFSAGLGWYATRHFGLATDVMVFDGPLSDVFVSASAILRLPVDYSSIAFYGMFGGGHQFGGIDRFNVHVGGGLDVRLTDSLSSFFDFRYTEPRNFNGVNTFRVGLRFLF